MSLLELWRKQDEEEKKILEWLKLNNTHLIFDREMEDRGFAFVEALTVTDTRDGREVYSTSFYNIEEADKFIDDIINS